MTISVLLELAENRTSFSRNVGRHKKNKDMEINHEIINSIVLVIISVIIYVQRESISSINKNLKAIDIDKILASKKYLDLARDKEIEIAVKEKEQEVVSKMIKGIQSGQEEVWEIYGELLSWHVKVLSGMKEKERSKIIADLPKNQEFVAKALLTYQSGELVGYANASASRQQSQDS
jgi:hypothetical protein